MKKWWLLGLYLISAGCATPSPNSSSLVRSPSSYSPAQLCERLRSAEIHSHRGAWDRPENMISAFVRGVEQGADFIEMDLQISKDNHIIVAHDAFMKKECRDAQGHAVSDKVFYRHLTLKQIKTYNCGSIVTRGVPVPGEKISSLDEVIAALKDLKTTKGYPIKLNIEVKYNPTQPEFYPAREFYADRILAVIDGSGINPAQVMIQSFDIEMLKVIRSRRADLRLSPLLSDASGGVQIAQTLRADLVTPHFSQVTPEMLARYHAASEIHPQGIKVVPWTVNDPENAAQLLEWGVDGFITDNPEWFNFAKSFCSQK